MLQRACSRHGVLDWQRSIPCQLFGISILSELVWQQNSKVISNTCREWRELLHRQKVEHCFLCTCGPVRSAELESTVQSGKTGGSSLESSLGSSLVQSSLGTKAIFQLYLALLSYVDKYDLPMPWPKNAYLFYCFSY